MFWHSIRREPGSIVRFMPLRRVRDYLALLLLGISAMGVGPCVGTPGLPHRVVLRPKSSSTGLGKTVQFRNWGTGHPTTWSIVSPANGGGTISPQGLYRAPYFLPADPIVTIRAAAAGEMAQAQVGILNVPPQPSDCAGEGQSLPGYGEFVYVEELPEAITRVAPAYPDSARDANVQGTVLVRALVCASGMIYDTRIDQSIPLLDGAAVAAVRQWVFLPAKSDGNPIAVWVVIPIRFTLHAPRVAFGAIQIPQLATRPRT